MPPRRKYAGRKVNKKGKAYILRLNAMLRKGKTTMVAIPRSLPNGFPKSKMVRMRYCDQITIDPAIGSVGTHQFRCNSIFDPDFTGTGHQPYTHDTWATVYQHYRVVGSRIRATVMSRGVDSSTFQGVCGIRLADTSTTITNPSLMMETALAPWKSYSTNNSRGTTLYQNFSAKKFFTKQKAGSDSLQASFGSNPTEIAFYQVWVASGRATDDAPSLDVQIQIDYIVLLFEPQDFAQS